MAKNEAPVQVAEEVDEDERSEPGELTGSLIPVETISAATLFGKGEGIGDLLSAVRRNTSDIVPDTSTEKGRKQIKSLAYRVSRTKTSLEELRKKFTEDRRAELKAIDANGKLLSDELDKIRDDVRKPFDEWQVEEEARQQKLIDDAKREAEEREAAEAFAIAIEGRITHLRSLPAMFVDLELAQADTLLAQTEATQISAEDYGDRLAEAAEIREASLSKVRKLIAMQRALAESEAREAKLLQEQADRDAADRRREAEEQQRQHDEKIQREQQEAIKRERMRNAVQGLQTKPLMDAVGKSVEEIDRIIGAVEAEQRALTADEWGDFFEAAKESCATALRKLSEQRADRVEEDAERERQRAADAQAKEDAEKQRKLDEVARVKAQKEADDLRIENERLAKLDADRKAKDAKDAAEEAERVALAKKESHRKQIREAAIRDIMCASEVIDRVTATKVIAMIEAGEVSNVTLNF